MKFLLRSNPSIHLIFTDALPWNQRNCFGYEREDILVKQFIYWKNTWYWLVSYCILHQICSYNNPNFVDFTCFFYFVLSCILGKDDMKLHCCVAAYVSDYFLLGTALLPYPKYRAQFSASLDHAMWFHSTFRADEWMLYECESPWAGQHMFFFYSCIHSFWSMYLICMILLVLFHIRRQQRFRSGPHVETGWCACSFLCSGRSNESKGCASK